MGATLANRLGMDSITVVGGTTPDRKFTFEIARCIGACGLSPALMIDDVVYRQMSPSKVDSVLATYK